MSKYNPQQKIKPSVELTQFDKDGAFLDDEVKEQFFTVLSKATWIRETDSVLVSLLLQEAESRMKLMETAEKYYDAGLFNKFATFTRLTGQSTDRVISMLDKLGLNPRARKTIKSIILDPKKSNKYDNMKLGINS